MIELINGECLAEMAKIPDNSLDAIICDPPYGTTGCKWDSIIPLDLMWEQLNRIIKPTGAIVLFGSQPFTSKLISSNYKMFKYEWIWKKNRGSNFVTVKYQPMKEHENILVFSKQSANYYPILQARSKAGDSRAKYGYNPSNTGKRDALVGFVDKIHRKSSQMRCPSSVQKFNCEVGLHPTQKPVALMEYLIKTYTNENETVLDFTMGSGTTGYACLNVNRNFIGIELDKEYFEVAKNRLNNHVKSDNTRNKGLLQYS